MNNEELIDSTIDSLLEGLQEAFGTELSSEDLEEVKSNTKTICAKMEASRSKSTKSK